MAVLELQIPTARRASAPALPQPFRPQGCERLHSPDSVYLPDGKHLVEIERVTASAPSDGSAPSLFWHLRVTRGIYRGVRVALPTSTRETALWHRGWAVEGQHTVVAG
jgi:hypothetical protein